MSLHPALRIGGLTVPYDQAEKWAVAYLDASSNRSSANPYAYPAYDSYNAAENLPGKITDADLLAPALLNVPISIRTYYGLQECREDLQRRLPPADTPALEDATDTQVHDLVKPLYALLDDPKTRPFGVKSTVLSKILHRKRPDFLVLHDTWVQTAYLMLRAAPVPDAPIPRSKDRSWSDYMVAISLAIRDDLRTQRETWTGLRADTTNAGDPPITLVRLLDIIAWHAGQHASVYVPTIA